jgi:aspartyl-tRNA(Asn)/glutamyl-tRNA(Gln) amidotransferase subunit C
MAVSKEDVEKIAELAKLKFDEAGKEKMQSELNKILEFIDELDELQLEDVEPMENINDTKNVFREDKVEVWLSTDEALKNAPEKTGKYVKVPRVLPKGK